MKTLERGFVVDGMRRCPCCRNIKPVEQFNYQRRKHRNGTVRIRIKPYCKHCTQEMNRRRTSADNSRRSRAWREANSHRTKDYAAAYCASEEGRRVRARVQLRRHHRQRAAGDFCAADIAWLLAAQGGKCAGCQGDIRKRHTIDHIMPVSRGGSNNAHNLQLLCRSCNSAKSWKLPEVWYREKGLLL